MSSETKNFGLTKPAVGDFYDINVFNNNMDIIDEIMNLVSLTGNDDLNLIRESGHYYWAADEPKNIPEDFHSGNMHSMRVWNSTDPNGSMSCYQELVALRGTAKGCKMQRIIDGTNNVVYPWEWVNAPMILDVEYRTTERYKDEAVYVTLRSDGIIHKRTESGLDITPITFGTEDLIEGESTLTTGCLYFVYE